MSDDQNTEIDQDHPWVQAAMNVPLQPTPSAVNLEDIEFTIDGKTRKAGLLTVADPSGVRTAFLPPSMLSHLVQQGTSILTAWDEEREKKPNLYVATPNVDLSKVREDIEKNRRR